MRGMRLVLPEAASRKPVKAGNLALWVADMTSVTGGQAMDGLFAGLPDLTIRLKGSSRR